SVAFESCDVGISQRFLLSGLRAAHISGDRNLGANILVYDLAEAQYQESLAYLGAEYPINRARNLLLLATARLNLGVLECACQAATAAADLIRGQDAEWVRILLENFHRALERHATSATVITFTTETADVLSGRTSRQPTERS